MPNIEVRSPDEIAGLPTGSLDVVVMHSVAQYLTPGELHALFVLFRRLLRPDGLFILGDIIPPDVSAATDAMALLRFAGANGFLIAAIARSRAHRGADRLLAAALKPRPHALWRGRDRRAGSMPPDFRPQRAPANIGHNPARMTFLARPKG